MESFFSLCEEYKQKLAALDSDDYSGRLRITIQYNGKAEEALLALDRSFREEENRIEIKDSFLEEEIRIRIWRIKNKCARMYIDTFLPEPRKVEK